MIFKVPSNPNHSVIPSPAARGTRSPCPGADRAPTPPACSAQLLAALEAADVRHGESGLGSSHFPVDPGHRAMISATA